MITSESAQILGELQEISYNVEWFSDKHQMPKLIERLAHNCRIETELLDDHLLALVEHANELLAALARLRKIVKEPNEPGNA